MKLSKLFALSLSSTLLIACGTTPLKTIEQAKEFGTNKIVAYQCHNNNLAVTYSFVGEQAKTAKVVINHNPILDVLVYQPNTEFTQFSAVNGDYTLNVDSGLTSHNYLDTKVVMLFKHSPEADEIVAKACVPNRELSKQLN